MTSLCGPRILRIPSICWYLIPAILAQERRKTLWDGNKTSPFSLPDGMAQG